MPAVGIVGRKVEQDILRLAISRTEAEAGGICLVSGDSGAGKTFLIESVLDSARIPVIRSSGGAPSGGLPYRTLRLALRDYLRRSSPAPSESLRARIDLAIDEPGPAPEEIPLAIREAFEQIALAHPAIVFLDDLQWADAASIDVLIEWAARAPNLPLLVIGAYRSDELPLRHPLRALRMILRRSPDQVGQLVHLGPLSPEESSSIVRRVLGEKALPEVIATVERRAHGLPFYLHELAAAAAESADDAAATNPERVVPESIRDAVLLRIGRLSAPAREAAEIAAAAGSPVRLDVLAELSDQDDAIDELLETGLLTEVPGGMRGSGEAAFRHDLVGEALYVSTPWARRRRHHAALAEALQARGVAPQLVATHWDRAHQPRRARPLWVAAAEAACTMHAYRDAKNALDQALAAWPEDEDGEARLAVIDRLGECAERCGDAAAASEAWEEVAAARRSAGAHGALAVVERRLAGLYELVNDWPNALSARHVAAQEFARAGLPVEAASERLAMAQHLVKAADVTAALGLIRHAQTEIDTADAGSPSPAGPSGLRARAMALEGHALALLGRGEDGIELTRNALRIALEAGPDVVAAEAYSLHAYTLEQATNYAAGLDTLSQAVSFCRDRGLDGSAAVCLACLTPALRHTGQWDRVIKVGTEVLASEASPEVARMVAEGEIGLVLANRGKTDEARRRLARASAFARAYQLFGLEIECSWGLARADELEAQHERAGTHLHELVSACLTKEERHYSVAALRWASSFFSRHVRPADLGACTNALAHIAAETGTAEATAALAHALGEVAMLEDDARRAADQFERSLELLAAVTIPPEIAETRVRAGVALSIVGEKEKAVERLVAAYHTARALGARPLAAAALRQLHLLGEEVERRSGRGWAARETGALTAREREVLRLLTTGLTNREIAGELFLSSRTVDMHVRNLLTKLGCHTRTEAARRANELALL